MSSGSAAEPAAARPAARRERPVAAVVARVSLLWFGLLDLAMCALLAGTAWHYYVHGYHRSIRRLAGDLVAEYASCGGDRAEMARHFAVDVSEHGRANAFLLLTEPDGREILSECASPSILARMKAEAAASGAQRYRIRESRAEGLHGRVDVHVRTFPLPDGREISVGWNAIEGWRHLRRQCGVLAAWLLLSLAAVAMHGLALGRRIAAPLRGLAEASGRIAAGDWSARVPAGGGVREFSDLQRAFNAMAAENQRTLAELRTLSDDLAHDLRTPLARLRAAAEAEATGAPSPVPLAQAVAEETDGMLGLVSAALEITRAGRGLDRTPPETLDLAALARRAAELYAAVAEESGLELRLDAPEDAVPVRGSRARLQRILGNLLDNAVKYTPRGGRVAVAVADGPPSLAVSNTGPGIAPEDVPRVFDRFWRGEKSRSSPGHGLGLALVRALAESAGATVSCTSEPGVLTVFRVVFPPAAAAC